VAGHSAAAAEQVLVRTDARSLTFEHDRIRWGGLDFPTALLRTTRAAHMVSFGSCSFCEPAVELHTLLLSHR
jgi:hypothetical protein